MGLQRDGVVVRFSIIKRIIHLNGKRENSVQINSSIHSNGM